MGLLKPLSCFTESEINQIIENSPVTVNFESGSYIGTGVFDSSNKNTIVFEKIPNVIIIISHDDNMTAILFPKLGYGRSWAKSTVCLLKITINANSVSWFGDNTTSQLNIENFKYTYLAIC